MFPSTLLDFHELLAQPFLRPYVQKESVDGIGAGLSGSATRAHPGAFLNLSLVGMFVMTKFNIAEGY